MGCFAAVDVVLQEEGQGGRSQAEFEAEEDEALEVTELLLGEGVTTQAQQLADPRGEHLHLGKGSEQGLVFRG